MRTGTDTGFGYGVGFAKSEVGCCVRRWRNKKKYREPVKRALLARQLQLALLATLRQISSALCLRSSADHRPGHTTTGDTHPSSAVIGFPIGGWPCFGLPA